MSEPKTRPTKASVEKFIESQASETVRDDCRTLVTIMQKISGAPPVMWGTAIVGFGSYVYHYSGGKELHWPLLAFSPRKQNLTLYLLPGFDGKKELLTKLGKVKTAKSCLYVKSLDGLHMPTLTKLIKDSYSYMVKKYGKS